MTPLPGTRSPLSRLAAATAVAVMLLAWRTEGSVPQGGASEGGSSAASDEGGATAAPEDDSPALQ